MESTHHLYRNAERYDLVMEKLARSRNDIAFYLRQAARNAGTVLELACGTGRLTIPLALKGVNITGVDISPEMLLLGEKNARQAGCTIIWHQANICDFNLNRRFSLIFIANNSLSHLHRRHDIEDCFACVREHLEPEGRFIVDVFNPLLSILTRDPFESHPVTEYNDPRSGQRVTLSETNQYDAASQVNHIQWRFSSDGSPDDVIPLDLRVFYPEELDALLAYNGFAIEYKYGTYEEGPFLRDSPKQLVVCRLAS